MRVDWINSSIGQMSKYGFMTRNFDLLFGRWLQVQMSVFTWTITWTCVLTLAPFWDPNWYHKLKLNWKTFDDRTLDFCQGITLHHLPGHTDGLIGMQLNLRDSGTFFFISDHCHVIENVSAIPTYYSEYVQIDWWLDSGGMEFLKAGWLEIIRLGSRVRRGWSGSRLRLRGGSFRVMIRRFSCSCRVRLRDFWASWFRIDSGASDPR